MRLYCITGDSSNIVIMTVITQPLTNLAFNYKKKKVIFFHLINEQFIVVKGLHCSLQAVCTLRGHDWEGLQRTGCYTELVSFATYSIHIIF